MSEQGQAIPSRAVGAQNAKARAGETLVDRVRHGVSRPVIRDALGGLREEALVYSRQGAGSLVKRRVDARALGAAPVETIAAAGITPE